MVYHSTSRILSNAVADLDGNGRVNVADINRARSISDFFSDPAKGITQAEKNTLTESLSRMVSAIKSASGSDNLVADLNGDGRVNIADISIARHLLAVIQSRVPTKGLTHLPVQNTASAHAAVRNKLAELKALEEEKILQKKIRQRQK